MFINSLMQDDKNQHGTSPTVLRLCQVKFHLRFHTLLQNDLLDRPYYLASQVLQVIVIKLTSVALLHCTHLLQSK